ncbi:MAG TPA: hypothetical protein VNL15_05330 [Dehalococcoidia bacterium]|nr:hypothetical protein [Dehalococcoidia bacterium]
MATVTVTERATEQLRSVLESASNEESECLRLVMQPEGGLALGLDAEREEDQSFKSGEKTILVIGPAEREALDGATIDVEDGDEGPRFTITR